MKSLISKQLNILKALAIIWIAFYHIPVECNIPVIGSIKAVGYGGVDVFVFLAGFGLYHSLEKNDLGDFYRRRLVSILPYYIPFIINYLIIRKLTYQLFLTEAVGNITMTGWLAGNQGQFNWYVDALLVLYLLAPAIYYLLKKSKNLYLCGVVLLGASFIVSVNFWHTELLILATRIPIFVLGFLFADDRLTKLLNNKIFPWILNAVSALGILGMIYLFGNSNIDRWHYGTWWYPFFLIIPGITVDFAYIFGLVEKFISLKCLRELGKMTFSIYLWHIFVFEYMQSKGEYNILIWFLTYILVFVFACVYHILINNCVKKFKHQS